MRVSSVFDGKKSALSFATEKERPRKRAPGAGGGCKGVRRRGQTACCLPSRHSLNGACFCAVKARFYCARSTRIRGHSRQNGMRMVLGAFYHQKVHNGECETLGKADWNICNMKEHENSIYIKGARVHNLRNIEVEIPHNKLVVVTGLSGSGKSTAARCAMSILQPAADAFFIMASTSVTGPPAARTKKCCKPHAR